MDIREFLLRELENYFSSDTKRINHAKKVLAFAEELLEREKADYNIIVAAAILHDVGIKAAEEKYNSSAGCYQEELGPGIAKNILLKAGFKKEDTEEICRIIAYHHSPDKVGTRNFKVLYDADWLVNLKDEADIGDKVKLKSIIDKVFLTKSGRLKAERLYLGRNMKKEF